MKKFENMGRNLQNGNIDAQEELDVEKRKIIEQYKITLFKKLEAFGIVLDSDRKDQHLIVNPFVIDDLINFGDINKDDTVLEIGAGPGNITEKLVDRAGHVYTLEIDKRFEPILQALQSEHPNLEVIMGDFLETELPDFNKIVANPPFSILEPMIQKLGDQRFELASLVIGDSYYKRTLARPGTDNFTKTSLFTQAHFLPEYLRDLDKEDFYPKSRERAVIMRLVSNIGGGDFMLRRISDAFSEVAEKRVGFLVDNICHIYGGPRGKINVSNYEEVVSPDSLGINPAILSKRLQELSNREISQLVAKLLSLSGRKRH
jgi:16S rRNA (adenine1518-N6/adenine1519-N6)-dimethyltransferase